MEKVNHIVISRKDEKKLKEFFHMCELAGLKIDEIQGIFDDLKHENVELKQEISDLKASFEGFKEEMREEIKKELNQIAVNVHNEVVKNQVDVKKNMEAYLFKGSHINEQY